MTTETLLQDSKPKESLTLQQLFNLTSIEQVKEQLCILNEQEGWVDEELDQMMQKQCVLDESLGALDFVRPQVAALCDESSRKLQAVVGSTAELAEKISSKVRQLDLEQSRVRQVMTLVDDILDLKACARGAKDALAVKDYEIAAAHVKRYLNFDLKSIALIFDSEPMDPESASNPETFPFHCLKSSQQELIHCVTREFDDAIQSNNEQDILRFARLFPMIGHGLVGLDKFSSFLASLISRKAQDRMSSIPDSTADPVYANLLTSLFESVAKLVDRQYHIIEKSYGISKMLLVIQKLQRQAEIQATIILDAFAEKRCIKRVLYDIKNSKSKQGTESTFIEPRELDLTLHEIALISQRFILFDQFLRLRAREELEKRKLVAADDDDVFFKETDRDGLVLGGKLAQRVDQLLSDYLVMQDYYVRKSIDKAMRLDTYEQGNQISSCVDDVFFIIKKCFQRSLASNNMRVLSVFASTLGKLLDVEFVSKLQKKLQNAFSSIDSKESKIQFMIIMNNVDVSCDYMKRLADEMTLELNSEHRQKTTTNNSVDQAKSALSIFLDYSKTLRESVKIWIENFFNTCLKSKLRLSLAEAHKDIKYVLSEDEFALADVEHFPRQFLNSIEKRTTLYKSIFAPGNFIQLILFVVDLVNKEMEKICLASKFNQLGALKLDKSIRSIISYFTSSLPSSILEGPTSQNSSLGVGAIRDRFMRLNQISTILNTEQLSDIQDMWSGSSDLGSSIKWRLTAVEVKKFLSSRIEFNNEDITKLKLS